MKLSGVAETVTVTRADADRRDDADGAPRARSTKRRSATTPILGRKFEDLLTLTPGVSVVQGPDGDEITFAGQRGVFNNISLDGGDYNNGFFGEQVGGQRAAIDITLDAVKEFQVDRDRRERRVRPHGRRRRQRHHEVGHQPGRRAACSTTSGSRG